MTDKQKYAIKLAINTMDKHFGRHYNTAYCNRETGIRVEYGEAINILSDMLSNDDNHTCNCQHNSDLRDNEPCRRCDSKQTNADRIRNMSDEELLDFICSIETYEEGSVKTIRNGIAMCSVTEIEKWLQSEAE
jgi:hypothetical protein